MDRKQLWYLPVLTLAPLALTMVANAENRLAPADADGVASWVRDLDADSYALRKIATDRLIEVGAAAAEPLVNALPDGSREFVHRAIYILDRMARSSDSRAAKVAEVALRQAATDLSGPAASGALHVLSELDRWRQQKALVRLRELGARVYFRELLNPRVFQPVLVESNRLVIDANWKGQREDLRLLELLTSLQDLQFEGPQFTDADLQYVANVRQLESITLKRTRVTDAGLAHLTAIPQLRQVTLFYTPITDQAVARLETLPTLQKLVLIGTEMSRPASERLESRLGQGNVEFHRGAFLGVEGGVGVIADGCPVMRVTPGSAAHKAGIAAGDIILSVGGKHVDHFEMLQGSLAERRAGDKVDIEVRRRTETLVKKVILGEWK